MSKQTANPRVSQILVGLVFLSLWSALPALAQGQQPTVLIDFEQFSAPINQFGGPRTLAVGSATFVGLGVMYNQGTWATDETTVFGNTFNQPELSPPSGSCSGGLEIDFQQRLSYFSALRRWSTC